MLGVVVGSGMEGEGEGVRYLCSPGCIVDGMKRDYCMLRLHPETLTRWVSLLYYLCNSDQVKSLLLMISDLIQAIYHASCGFPLTPSMLLEMHGNKMASRLMAAHVEYRNGVSSAGAILWPLDNIRVGRASHSGYQCPFENFSGCREISFKIP